MKILAFVHFYPPHRLAGSETMLHAMLRALVDAGHEVEVLAARNGEDQQYKHDGIPVTNTPVLTACELLEAARPDVVITHHDYSPHAARSARKTGAKVVLLIHNEFPRTLDFIQTAQPDLTVVNTRWMLRKHASRFRGRRTLVVHPPVHAERHRTTPGDRITLVNLNQHKGAELFYWLARWMPEQGFLGVVGGHGEQIIDDTLPNLEIQPQTSDMPADVWSRTKIVLMPSLYESYGMAGVEALASGIPVIANPTPGLLESLSYAGTFVDRDDGQGWVDALDALLEPEQYYAASALARLRSDELNPADELATWVEAVENLRSTP